jgi:hypothetical protein
MPAFEITDLTMGTGVQLKRLLQSAPLAHRVAIFGIMPQTQHDSVIRQDIAATQMATLRMIGLYDSSAHLREWELWTTYEAAKFFVLFDPPPDHRSHALAGAGPRAVGKMPRVSNTTTGSLSARRPGIRRATID